MIPLPTPPAADDDAYLAQLCQGAAWLPHHHPWLAAYGAYRQHGGNPWNVAPTTFNPDVGGAQCALYDTRRSGSRIRKIRDTVGLLSCPMCGSLTTGGLDHFLPRAVYPEFSIMAANLVPACSHCNSGAKGDTYRGVSPERLIHPYFDTLAQAPLWQVEFVPPYEATTFRAVPMPGLSHQHAVLVAFHLKHVLGKQFRLSAQTQWSKYPQLVRNGIDAATAITVVGVRDVLAKRLRDDIVSTGQNSWHSALLRGLLANPQAQSFILTKAELLAPTPLM